MALQGPALSRGRLFLRAGEYPGRDTGGGLSYTWGGDEWETVLAESQRQVGELVNHYSRERLFLMHEIADYAEALGWPY